MRRHARTWPAAATVGESDRFPLGPNRLRNGLAVACSGALATAFVLLAAASPARALVGPPADNPLGRHYEMVSPPNKGGNDVSSKTTSVHLSEDGQKIAYASTWPFPGAPASGMTNQYRSTRTDAGWSLRFLNVPQDPYFGAATTGSMWQGFSDDLSAGVLSALDPGLTPDAAPKVINLYQGALAPNTTEYDLVTEPLVSGVTGVPEYSAASSDFDTVFFTETQGSVALTPDAPNTPWDQAYVWTPSGLRYVGHLPGGGVATEGSAIGRNASTIALAMRAATSDASSVVFTAKPESLSGPLYLWREGAPPLEVASDGEFMVASADHSKLFFRSNQKLTPDATAEGELRDLYLYEPATEALTDLTTASPTGAGILGVLGSSESGSQLYFAATGDLAPGATAGEPNLYLWEEGAGITFIATLAHAALSGPDESDIDNWNFGLDDARLQSRVSSDGDRLLFASTEPLTSYDNNGHREIYLYDAPTGALTCISCRPDGKTATGDASVALYVFAEPAMRYVPRLLSDDGSRAFFNTPEPLVREDVNGRVDVYEYAGGGVRLVSTGRGGADAVFTDATPDGADVVFATRQPISGWDRDDAVDLYMARAGGSPLPEPPPDLLLGSCEGEACKGPLPAAPVLQRPGSLIQRAEPRKKRPAPCPKRGSRKRGKGKAAKRVHPRPAQPSAARQAHRCGKGK